MGIITGLLELAQNILVYLKEFEAAGIIDIVREGIAQILANIPMPL